MVGQIFFFLVKLGEFLCYINTTCVAQRKRRRNMFLCSHLKKGSLKKRCARVLSCSDVELLEKTAAICIVSSNFYIFYFSKTSREIYSYITLTPINYLFSAGDMSVPNYSH